MAIGAQPALWRRLWSLPLWAHAGVLAVVLVALVPLVGTGANLSADEGAVVAQAEALRDDGRWELDHPFAEVDPEGVAFPLEKSTRGEDGFAPFAKHPVYPLVLAGQPLGSAGMVLLSVLGTVVAAALAGLLARRMPGGSDRPTLWAVGVASPLFFDSYVVIAHTLGAAAAAGAVLLALEAVDRRLWWAGLAAGGSVFLAVLLRSEAVLFGLVLGGVVGLLGLRRRDGLTMAVGVLAGGAAAAGFLLDRWLGTQVVAGSEVAGLVGGGAEPDLVAGRVQGFVITWLLPGYHIGLSQLLGFLALVGAIVVALRLRRRPEASQPVLVVAGLVLAALVLRLFFEPALVPGLLVAFPVLVVGLLVLRGKDLQATATRVALVVSLLFAAAVLLTQYASGGSGEWGGRYFALVLPVVTPVAVVGLRSATERWDLRARRLGAGIAVGCCGALALSAVLVLEHLHGEADRLVADVQEVAAATDPGDEGPPVVVTTEPALPRLAWDHLDDARFLLVDVDEAAPLAERLADAGVAEVVLVERPDELADGGRDPDDVVPATDLGPYRETWSPPLPGSWTVRVLASS